MMLRPIYILALLLVLYAPLADAGKAILLNLSLGDFSGQRAIIESVLANDKGYAERSREDTAVISTDLDAIATLLGDVTNVTLLGEVSRKQAADLELRVNERMTKVFRDSRMVCQRIKQTGSNISRNTCMSAANWKQLREDSKETMRTMQAPLPQEIKSH